MDVYFYEAFAEEAKALKQILPAHFKVDFTDKTIQEASHAKPPASLISIRTQSRVPEGWKGRLQGVLSRSKGYDHILTLKDQGVQIKSLEEYCSRSVAESAFLLMLALMRKLPQQIGQFESFDRDGLTGRDAQGKKVLVLGVGSIGSQIVRLCTGFGMDVRGVDVDEANKPCPLVSLDEGMVWAEVVFVAWPLTDQTRGRLDAEIIGRSPKGLILINIARGEITPFKDLKALFDQNHLAGLGVDVYEEEGSLANALRSGEIGEKAKAWLELAKDPRVLCTPHNAFNSEEALEEKAKRSVQAIIHFIEKGSFVS